jgi:hypothetical protein
MNPFVAVILICLNTVALEACDETTAADVLSTGVENELSCAMGWQDVVTVRRSQPRSAAPLM